MKMCAELRAEWREGPRRGLLAEMCLPDSPFLATVVNSGCRRRSESLDLEIQGPMAAPMALLRTLQLSELHLERHVVLLHAEAPATGFLRVQYGDGAEKKDTTVRVACIRRRLLSCLAQ